MSNDLRRGRHVVYNLHVHLVFVAKYRRKLFTKEILDDMQTIFEKVCSNFEAELIDFDGESDHVHLLVVYPPKVAISSLVNSLKGVFSRLLRKKEYPSVNIVTKLPYIHRLKSVVLQQRRISTSKTRTS